MNTHWYKGLLCALLLMLPGLASAAPVDQVIIVKSSENSYFNRSIETLVNHVDEAVRFKTLMAKDLPQTFENGDKKQIFVTLGAKATEAVGQLQSGLNSFAAYLTQEQFDRLQYRNQSVVLLDQPLHRYLAFCKSILGIESVGIIVERKIELDRHQTEVLDRLDLVLNQYRIDPLNKLLPVLRNLLQQNDALLMLPRQSIYNRDSLKGVLLTSYRNRKPVISYSPAHVKSGALASIYSSPVDIGRHLAQLINNKLKNPANKIPAYQYARFYSIATNRRVARALGIDLPAEGELRSAIDELEP